jgi:hypothetical protein
MLKISLVGARSYNRNERFIRLFYERGRIGVFTTGNEQIQGINRNSFTINSNSF